MHAKPPSFSAKTVQYIGGRAVHDDGTVNDDGVYVANETE